MIRGAGGWRVGALVLALLCAWALAGVAATIAVPGDHPTIQEAINAASQGDIIEVAAGTYQERITIPEALTGLELRGAQYGVDARDRTGADESIIGGVGMLLLGRQGSPYMLTTS